MKKYRVLKPILLGFVTTREQTDTIISPADNMTLECDGQTIWVVKDETRRESISFAWVIAYFIDQGKIVEIPE